MAGEASKAIDPKVLWGGGRSPFSTTYGKQMMWFFLISDALTFGALLTALGFFKHKYQDIWPVSEEVFQAFPGMGHTPLPLMYVALMTFILIVSSVTMVLAVEAGHRMDKKNVIKWLALTVVGGFFFLGSQVWEWSHYIHGTEHGAVKLEDGRIAQWKKNADHTIDESTLILWENRKENQFKEITGAALNTALETGERIYGANLSENEYGVKQYSQFFFFVTGFHGFHVFSGVIINLIVLIMVINGKMHARGHYEMVEKTGLYWHFVDLVWVFVFTFYYLL